MILPDFLEATEIAGGANRVGVKREITITQAMRVLDCCRISVIGLIDSGQIHARRLTDRPKSMYRVCGECCVAWRERQHPCPRHNLESEQKLTKATLLPRTD